MVDRGENEKAAEIAQGGFSERRWWPVLSAAFMWRCIDRRPRLETQSPVFVWNSILHDRLRISLRIHHHGCGLGCTDILQTSHDQGRSICLFQSACVMVRI